MTKKKIVKFVTLIVSVLAPCALFAQEHAASATVSETGFGLKTALAIAAGFGIAIASFGGALAQGKTAAAALEGIARNPESSNRVMTPMIIALALIESLVIYSLVIAFLLQGKI